MMEYIKKGGEIENNWYIGHILRSDSILNKTKLIIPMKLNYPLDEQNVSYQALNGYLLITDTSRYVVKPASVD